MTSLNPEEILRRIDLVDSETNPRRAEELLVDVLVPLLRADGYRVEHTGGPGDRGIDFLATSELPDTEPTRIGVQYKHLGRPATVDVVQQVIGASIVADLDRMILLSRSGFSEAARGVLNRQLPTAVELIDLAFLRSWAARFGQGNRDPERGAAVIAITELSAALARIVARNPVELENIEWRDLERLLDVVFAKLGFQTTLTPPAKDGGRDVILRFSIEREHRSFIVEAKHWRSRQRVGKAHLTDFLRVVATEKRDGGLFLATYGYAGNAFEVVTEVDKQLLHTGDQRKIVALCRTFVRAEAGLFVAPRNLTEVITSDTETWPGERTHAAQQAVAADGAPSVALLAPSGGRS